MKVFPREHGATVIWFTSILTTFLTMPTYPSVLNILFFLTISFVILILIAKMTSLKIMMIKMQLNEFILPIITGLLTSITILGHYIMFETISLKNLSIWFLFLTFTIISVTLIQKELQGLISMNRYPISRIAIFGLGVFSIEFIIMISIGLMHPIIVLSIAPLISMWIYLKLNQVVKSNSYSKVKIIRGIGFFQSWNIIIFVLILAILSRL